LSERDVDFEIHVRRVEEEYVAAEHPAEEAENGGASG
jgi:hypothetical protein